VNSSRAQVFLAAVALFFSPMSIRAELSVGQKYTIDLVDVDGNKFSTADGRITVLVLTSQSNIEKARAVGDRIPDFCLANLNYRMMTVLAFEKNHSRPVRAVMNSMVRRRLDSEARRLQSRYDQLKISRDARHDVVAVADFGSAIAKQLGSEWSANLFRAFVFGKNGEVINQWSDVPSAEELSSALKLEGRALSRPTN
jgi:hypothetical protein